MKKPLEDDIESPSFSELLLKRSLELGKEAGCSREELPKNVEEATVLVLTTLLHKVCPDDMFPSGKPTAAQCFLCVCAFSVCSELKESNPEIELIDLIGKVGNVSFMVFETKERKRIVTEGYKNFRALADNVKNNDNVKDWFENTCQGVKLYICSANDVARKDKTDMLLINVLKRLYLNLCETKESWS